MLCVCEVAFDLELQCEVDLMLFVLIDYVDGIVSGDQIPGKIMEMLKKRMKHSQIKEPMTNGVKEKLIIETLKSLKRR